MKINDLNQFRKIISDALQNRFVLESTYQFSGTCVNSFDEDGSCTAFDNYNDVTDFAQAEENAEEISKQQFDKLVGQQELNNVPKIKNKKNLVYLHDKENDVVMAYDQTADVHYFFIKNKNM